MNSSATIPHAGVPFPPPFVYVAGIAAGWLLDRWKPLPMTGGPSTGRFLAAVLCIVTWMAIFGWSYATFRRARTTLIPNRPATNLVQGGPYRFTRNPMYVSLVALYLGLALILDSWWLLILLPLVILGIDRFVIGREERYLASAFPDEYAAYRDRVRRWI